MTRTSLTQLGFITLLTTVLVFALPTAARSDEDAPWQDDLETIEATIESLQDEQSRIRISGRERVRIMNISSGSHTTTGPFGEILRKGNTVRYRLGLTIEATVTPSVVAGGWLRLSNEGTEILTRGPDYLSLERGSAFVRYRGRYARMQVGYFPLHFTPLTLMRWDLEDNPQGGGSMACAVCGAATGLLSAESLEELGPTLVLEGARGDLSLGDVCDLTTFYANPNRAQEDLYHRDLWGFRTVLHAYGPGGSRGSLATTYLRADDDENSLENPKLGLEEISTELVGLDAEVQPIGPLTFTGEWDRTHAVKAFGQHHGEAYIVGIRSLVKRRFAASFHYIHIDSTFRSPYAALSYLPNRKGIRISGGWRSRGHSTSVTVFCKKLDEIRVALAGVEPKTFTTWGFGLRLSPLSAFAVETNLILDLEKRFAPDQPWLEADARKRTSVVDLVRELGSQTEVRIRYQVTDFKDKVPPGSDFVTHLTSMLWSVEF